MFVFVIVTVAWKCGCGCLSKQRDDGLVLVVVKRCRPTDSSMFFDCS